jgi:uncharacterized Zn-binding protein involved in type VI secretion
MKMFAAAVCIIVMLGASAPAATVISCARVGTANDFTIAYNYDTVGSFPRAFALDVTTSAGIISGVTATKVGESTSASKGFGIFPGTIVIDSAGNVTNVGSPVAPSGDPGALGGIGTSGVTIELGSLYADVSGKPDNSGVLVAVRLSGVTLTATVSVTANTTRGGIVLEDGTSVGSLATTCYYGPPPCKGDLNSSFTVTTADILPLINLLNTYGGKSKTISSSSTNYSIAGDVNWDGQNSTGDILPLINMLNTYGGKAKTITCPHTY